MRCFSPWRLHGHLLVALVLQVVENDDQRGAALDGLRLVEGGASEGQAIAGRHIAIAFLRFGSAPRGPATEKVVLMTLPEIEATACEKGLGWPTSR